MRKLITVLVIAIVLIGTVFATDATLNITTTIAKVEPSFTLGGVVVADASATPGTYELSNSSIATGKNIALEDIYVAITVFQNNVSFYQDTTGFDLTVTATPLWLDTKTQATATVSEKTDDPTIAENTATAGADVTHTPTGGTSALTDFHPVMSSATGSVVTYHVTYPSGVKVAGNAALASSAAKVGTAVFKWTAKDSLVIGSYTATITLSYTTN